MKRLFAALGIILASWLWLVPTSAQFDKTNGCANAGFCSPNSAKVTPVSNACTTSSGTSITFTAQGTGGPNPNRTTVVTINWDDSTAAGTAQLTTMTVGGIAMTRAVANTAGVTNSNSEIWYVANPTGSTANIVATFATAVNGVTIEVYSLVGFLTTPIANTTGTTSATQTFNNKQVALAAASRTVNVSTSLSNMVNDFSSACGANLWGVHASQKLNGNSGSLTTTISPTSNNPKIALAVWTVDCASTASAFLARTSGLNATHTKAYTDLICGLFADNIWNKLDVLHIYATQDSTTALLNLRSTSFSAVTHGSPTFTADRGFTGVAGSSTVFIDTQFNAQAQSGTSQFSLSNGHISAWSVINTAAQGSAIMGTRAAVNTVIYPKFTDNNAYFKVNSENSGVANSDSSGHYIATRNSSSSQAGYRNGSSIFTDSTAPVLLQNLSTYVLADNLNSVAEGSAFQVAEASIGSSLTAADSLKFYTRLRTYMTAVGVP